MSEEEIERKIAVIFATDVVGYSKHMEADESSTIKNLRACEKILTALFEKHKGRLFNTGGDSFLAEFPSAVSAVECAVEFQKAIKDRNSSDDTSVKLEFRIGINSGDVVKEKENLLGDGVNIAARLEALAQAGGITLSKVIYDYVKGKTSHEFNDLGVQKVKQNEFHAYDVILNPNQKRRIKVGNRKKLVKRFNIFAVSIFVFCSLVGAYFYYFSFHREEIAQIETDAKPVKKSSIPIVLIYPISDVSVDSSQVKLGPAVTESMIASLSRFLGISVLSGSTSFSAEDDNLNDKQIRKSFQADYVVRGSIQTLGKQSRITVSLSDLAQDKVVWSDNRDFNMEEIFSVQDTISNGILSHLQINAVTGSRAKTWAAEWGNLDRVTRALNWRNEWRKFTPEGYNNAVDITNDLANEIGEDHKRIINHRAFLLFQKLRLNLSDDKDVDIKALKSLLEKANEPENIETLHLRGVAELNYFSKDCDISKRFSERALELGGSVDAFTTAGVVYFLCKDYPKSIASFQNALRLVPNDNGWFITRYLGTTLYRAKDFSSLQKLIEEDIDSEDMPPVLIAYYSFIMLENGEKGKAKEYFDLAKSKGLSKKYLTRYDMNDEIFQNFKVKMQEIGVLE